MNSKFKLAPPTQQVDFAVQLKQFRATFLQDAIFKTMIMVAFLPGARLE